MSQSQSAAQNRAARDRIVEEIAIDARGRSYSYFRCTRCGVEGTYRPAVDSHECGESL